VTAHGTVRAVVVDDEPAARDAVRTLLAEHQAVKLVGEAANGAEAVEVLRSTRPDLVFLDVQMPDEDGFGVLEQLGADVPRGVVFVTAHDQHAIRAFEVHALDYLLKPFGRPRFAATVQRALDRLQALDALTLRRTLESMADDRRSAAESAAELAEPVVSGAAPAGGTPTRIGVRTGGRLILVAVDEIDWVEASGDHARIHAGRQAWLITHRMHSLERLLAGGEFLRIHRSLIVNLHRIRELHREGDGAGTVVLQDGVRLRVSRGRWEALHAALRMTAG
jgi:two-component system LytT family response regulator